jgi:hypothetical protein
MSIKDNHMLVSVGGKGLGYINLFDGKYVGLFVNL